MESVLTIGNETLHDQTKKTLAQEWFWLFILFVLLYYSGMDDGAGMAE